MSCNHDVYDDIIDLSSGFGILTPWIKKYILVYTLAIGPYTKPYDMSTCYGISHNKS